MRFRSKGSRTQTQTERKRKHFRNAAFSDTKRIMLMLHGVSQHLLHRQLHCVVSLCDFEFVQAFHHNGPDALLKLGAVRSTRPLHRLDDEVERTSPDQSQISSRPGLLQNLPFRAPSLCFLQFWAIPMFSWRTHPSLSTIRVPSNVQCYKLNSSEDFEM